MIGHREPAESLIQKYNLETKFAWIKEAKKEEYIADPCRQIMVNGLEIFGKGYVDSKYPNYPGTSRKNKEQQSENAP